MHSSWYWLKNKHCSTVIKTMLPLQIKSCMVMWSMVGREEVISGCGHCSCYGRLTGWFTDKVLVNHPATHLVLGVDGVPRTDAITCSCKKASLLFTRTAQLLFLLHCTLTKKHLETSPCTLSIWRIQSHCLCRELSHNPSISIWRTHILNIWRL